MIRYALKCDHDHAFESWFASAAAFDRLAAAKMVACSVCGSLNVEKSLMVPALRSTREPAPLTPAPPPVAASLPAAPPAMPSDHPLSQPQSELEQALAALRRSVEETSDYVGADFVSEARAIHEGEAPERSIWGEARLEDARALAEDGVAVIPLPFMQPRKTN